MANVRAMRLFAPALLTASVADYYTVPSNLRTTILKLTFTNTTANARTVTVYLVESGGVVGDSNKLVVSRTIAPNDTWECTWAQGHVMNNSDKLRALADSAAAVNIMASGMEVTI